MFARSGLFLFLLALPSFATAQESEAQKIERLRGQFDRLIVMIGAVSAIEAQCPGYRITPQMEGAHASIGLIMPKETIKDIVLQAGIAMAAIGQHYNLNGDPKGFCRRVLADFGPASPNPVVEKASRKDRR